jgi:hypothetical protein
VVEGCRRGGKKGREGKGRGKDVLGREGGERRDVVMKEVCELEGIFVSVPDFCGMGKVWNMLLGDVKMMEGWK